MFAAVTSPAQVTLTDALQITFGSATGHTLGATGSFSVTVTLGSQIQNLGGTYLASTALDNPTTPTATPSTGGSTPYTYCMAGLFNGVSTACSPTVTAMGNGVLSADPITVVGPGDLGATACNFYRTASGGTPSTTGIIAGPIACDSTVIDNGLAGDGSRAPTVNLTGHLILNDGYITTPTGVPYDFPEITGNGCIGINAGIVSFTAIDCTPAASISNISVSVSSGTQANNSCSTPTPVTMTGVAITPNPSALWASYSSNPASLTGWGTTGGMVFQIWASAANQATWQVCNQTALSISYSAITFEVGAHRADGPI
jgi:hypothetical protein